MNSVTRFLGNAGLAATMFTGLAKAQDATVPQRRQPQPVQLDVEPSPLPSLDTEPPGSILARPVPTTPRIEVLTDAQRLKATQAAIMQELQGLADDLKITIPDGTSLADRLTLILKQMRVETENSGSIIPNLQGKKGDAAFFSALPAMQQMTGVPETTRVRVGPPLDGGSMSAEALRNEALEVGLRRVWEVREALRSSNVAPKPPVEETETPRESEPRRRDRDDAPAPSAANETEGQSNRTSAKASSETSVDEPRRRPRFLGVLPENLPFSVDAPSRGVRSGTQRPGATTTPTQPKAPLKPQPKAPLDRPQRGDTFAEQEQQRFNIKR